MYFWIKTPEVLCLLFDFKGRYLLYLSGCQVSADSGMRLQHPYSTAHHMLTSQTKSPNHKYLNYVHAQWKRLYSTPGLAYAISTVFVYCPIHAMLLLIACMSNFCLCYIALVLVLMCFTINKRLCTCIHLQNIHDRTLGRNMDAEFIQICQTRLSRSRRTNGSLARSRLSWTRLGSIKKYFGGGI